MSWLDGLKIAFDTETTGVHTDWDRIVTATVLVVDGASIEEHAWIVKPGRPIPAGATAVHGITDEFAAEHGRAPAEAVAEIVDAIGKHWSPDVPLIAYNASFDLSLLDAERQRHHGQRLDVAGPVIDPLVLDKAVDPYRKGSRKLGDTCLHYGVQLDNAHTSSDDALAAAHLAYKIPRRYPRIGDLDLATLHARQVEWHERQRASLESYLRRVKRQAGATPDEVAAVVCDRGWPVRTAP